MHDAPSLRCCNKMGCAENGLIIFYNHLHHWQKKQKKQLRSIWKRCSASLLEEIANLCSEEKRRIKMRAKPPRLSFVMLHTCEKSFQIKDFDLKFGVVFPPLCRRLSNAAGGEGMCISAIISIDTR